jgi:hypothetical protein
VESDTFIFLPLEAVSDADTTTTTESKNLEQLAFERALPVFIKP